ncbi:MAG: two-component system chemotaxis response regulator CheB [Sulfurimonas sp.]|uniref:chemotaxis protein CheB n=1 Tax=Sulfurimonas sp. TaxID=2022749 RepID=UPI0039E37857
MKSVIPKKLILIGASTGGPGQIEKILSFLPPLQDTSIVIAQHMVHGFQESFASRLQSVTENKVMMIQNKQSFESNTIYVVQGTTQLNCSSLIFTISQSSKDSYNPDINTLFLSFVPLSKRTQILSVILTGIGSDGVEGCKELSKHSAICITESENSAIVDGMPNRARALVPNIQIKEMSEIITTISEFCDV